MGRGTARCGGRTSGADTDNKFGGLTLAVLLPHGYLAGYRRSKTSAEAPKSCRLAASYLVDMEEHRQTFASAHAGQTCTLDGRVAGLNIDPHLVLRKSCVGNMSVFHAGWLLACPRYRRSQPASG